MAGEIILVVDDHPSNVKLLRTVLSRYGYVVVSAGDAREARESVRATRPHLILMDIQLPDVDGFVLTREFKADPALRDIPIVAVTSYAMKGDDQKSLAAGCDGYVSKPIDTRTFPALVERYLRRR